MLKLRIVNRCRFQPVSALPWLIVAAVLPFLACESKSPQPEKAPSVEAVATAPGDSAGQVARDADPLAEVVATSNLGDLTLAEILEYGVLAPVVPLSQLGTDRLRAAKMLLAVDDAKHQEAAGWIVSRLAAYQSIKDSPNPEIQVQFADAFGENARTQAIIKIIMDEAIERRVVEPTEAAVKATYDKRKPEFYKPFQFRMYHLILMTYEPYQVQEDDTLESIAERISGDAKQAGLIRSATVTRPLRRPVEAVPDPETKEYAITDFKPLVPGEELLVPMDEDKAQEIRQRMESILKELERGVGFQELCARYSESGTAGRVSDFLPTGTKPILPELLEPAKSLKVGEVSPIFRTRHGWQAIQIVERQEEGYFTLEESRDSIRDHHLAQSRAKLREEFQMRLFSNPKLSIEYGLIADGDNLTTDTVIARVGDQEVIWRDFSAEWKRRRRLKTPEGIRQTLQRCAPLVRLLLMDYAADRLRDPDGRFAQDLESVRAMTVGQLHLMKLATEGAGQRITTRTLHEVYEQNKDAMFRAWPEVTFVSMERRLAPENRDLNDQDKRTAIRELYGEMVADLQQLKSPEDFEEKAAEVNALYEGDPVAPLRMDQPVVSSELTPDLRTVVEKLEPGQWSEPMLLDGYRLASVMLKSKAVNGSRAQEEVISEVRKIAFKETYDRLMRDHQESLLRKVNYAAKP